MKLNLETKYDIFDEVRYKYIDKLVPECIALGYCNENKMQCNVYKDIFPTREEFNKIIKTKEYKYLVSEIKKQ